MEWRINNIGNIEKGLLSRSPNFKISDFIW